MLNTGREWILGVTADPNIAFALAIAGLLAIYFELSTAGWIVPGAAGAAAVLVGISRLSLHPIHWIAAMTLIMGVALLSSTTRFTIAAIVAMVLGSWRVVDGMHPGTAIGCCVPFALITMFLRRRIVHARSSKARD